VDDAITAVLDRGQVLLGPETEAFEADFAEYLGATGCVAVGNGTDALEIALRVVGVSAGDEVVTVANAGGYTTAVCGQLGAVPVYVDVAASTLTMDLEQAVIAVGASTAAVVVTHLYGWPVDVPRLRDMLDGAGWSSVPIIEDCAQAHGARVDGRLVGTLGDLAAFSFYPTKNLGAFGDAGAIVTSDPEVEERVRMLAQYGWRERYVQELPGGRNSRMDEIQAAILRIFLRGLDAGNESRRAIVKRYADATADSGSVSMAHGEAPDGYVAHLAVARTGERDSVAAELQAAGVATAIHYPVLDVDQPALAGRQYRTVGDLPESREAVAAILTVPCFPTMSDAEIDQVCDSLTSVGRSH
jgi:dTDP-4-amino-4,6-dideoxygalactose transaminase